MSLWTSNLHGQTQSDEWIKNCVMEELDLTDLFFEELIPQEEKSKCLLQADLFAKELPRCNVKKSSFTQDMPSC